MLYQLSYLTKAYFLRCIDSFGCFAIMVTTPATTPDSKNRPTRNPAGVIVTPGKNVKGKHDAQGYHKAAQGETSQAAVHRFVDRLEGQVQDAVDAARSRRLAPVKSVTEVCRYLQWRYLSVEQIKEPGGRYPRKPSSLVVEPDFVPGLMCLAPSRLAECVADLQEAIREVQPYEGKPFDRKPIVTGSSKEKVPGACTYAQPPRHLLHVSCCRFDHQRCILSKYRGTTRTPFAPAIPSGARDHTTFETNREFR